MRFHGQITAAKWIDRFKPERTTVFEGYFNAPNIQAAKAHLTRLANKTELFSYVQSWDNEKRVYTGKDLRWRPYVYYNLGIDAQFNDGCLKDIADVLSSLNKEHKEK